MENIAQHCSRLEELSLEGCMVSAAGLRIISKGPSSLKKVSISRCHVIDTQELPAIVQGMSELKVLAMNHIDGVQPYQVQAVIAECPRLRKVELVGCPEITLKAIRQLSSINKRVRLVHDARLEDHSIDSVRRFLLGLVTQ
jgi:F-box/leucine-rich repeat protein 2/20